MFDYVKGTVKEAQPTHVVLEANGIGYKILVALSTFSSLPALEKEVLIYTHLVIREDAHTLYGFLAKEERDLFIKCTAVSGIGPKTALSLLGHIPLQAFIVAIEHSDIPTICRVPGIGKKTAERLVLEMKDKAKELASIHLISAPGKGVVSDAIGALMTLGYNSIQAQKAVEKARLEKGEDNLSLLITSALQKI